MELSSRFLTALLCLVLLSLDPSYLVAADPDFNPTPNLETIRSCSLIIPMSKQLQNVGTSTNFNFKAYGLINHLLWADIPVKWVIKTGKAYLDNDFSALVEPIDVVSAANLGNATGSATTLGFRASAFIVPVTLSPFALPRIREYNARHPASPVKVYRLKENKVVDVRYNLNKKPFIATLDSSEFADVQQAYLDTAGFVNGSHYRYMSYAEANSLNSDVCVSMCTEPHFEPGETIAPSFVNAMHEFVNSGGNFLAQCGGITTYENCGFKTAVEATCTSGHFLSVGGIDTKPSKLNRWTANITNPDLAFSQHDSPWNQWVGGSVQGMQFDPSSPFKSTAYFGARIIDNGVATRLFHSSGVKVIPNRIGHNVWYITGHDVGGFEPALRQFLNAVLVPAQRDASCGLDVDECIYGGCSGYLKKREVEQTQIPCSCTEFCDATGKCGAGTTIDPICPVAGTSAPPKAAPAPRAAAAPRAPRTPSTLVPGAPGTGGMAPDGTPAFTNPDGTPAAATPVRPPGVPYFDLNSTQSTSVEESVANGFRYFAFVVSRDVASLQVYVEVLNWDPEIKLTLYLKKGGLPTASDYDCVVRDLRSALFDYRAESAALNYCKAPLPSLDGEWFAGVFSTVETGFAFEGFLEPGYGRVTEESITIGASSSLRPSFLLTALLALVVAALSPSRSRFTVVIIAGLLVLAISNGVSAQACSELTTCDACLYNALDCGWCGLTGVCLPGNLSGPSTGSCGDNLTWEFTVSRVISATGTDGVITPKVVEVFLRPGKPLTVPVEIRVPFLPPLDFYMLADSSFSMRDDVEAIRSAINNLVSGLKDIQNDTVFGLGSFIEKPQMPLCGWPECYSYIRHSALSPDVAPFNNALGELLGSLRRNNEHPECSLDAVVYAAMDSGVGFRAGSVKVAFVVTDASAHVAGDGPRLLGIRTPNNLDGIQDGNPPGSAEDYVSVAGMRSVCVAKDVNPIFGVIDFNSSKPILNYYRAITTQIGFGATVDLSNTAQIVQSIIDGTREALRKAILATDVDVRAVIKSISPAAGYTVTPPTSINDDVRVRFNITLEVPTTATWVGSSANATAKYVGFGNFVTFLVRTAAVCRGCDPNDPEKRLDRCGVCGGNNTCVGCDGVLFSGVIFDACGVCGGDNSTCRDCRGVINGNSTFDVCGVCGGNGTTCAGCDGIPLSGAVLNDCGECNGPPNCQAIQGAVIGLSVLAAVAVIAAVAAIIFLAVGAAKMASADAILFTQLNSLKENPLYKQAQSVKSNPLYRPT